VSVPKERLGKKSRTPIAKAPGKRPIIVFKKCENISEYYKTPEGPCLGLIQTSLPVKLFPVPWQCALAETSVRLWRSLPFKRGPGWNQNHFPVSPPIKAVVFTLLQADHALNPEHWNTRSVLVKMCCLCSVARWRKARSETCLRYCRSAKRPQTKTPIWAGATRVFVRFCRPNLLTGSLPPKSRIGTRQAPSESQTQKSSWVDLHKLVRSTRRKLMVALLRSRTVSFSFYLCYSPS